jgi:AcrR family transcriptional regulator
MASTSQPPSPKGSSGTASSSGAADRGDTRQRFIRAAQQTVRETGLANASARTIAARAGSSQGLIFYHFGTVSELLEAASTDAVEQSIASYRTELEQAESLTDLLAVGDELRRREHANGNVAFMAQMMAGAQHDPVLARAAGDAMSAWVAEVRAVLERALRENALIDLADLDGLARLIAAGFVGLELYDAVDPAGTDTALATLRSLGRLVAALDDLGPIASRAVRAATRRRTGP